MKCDAKFFGLKSFPRIDISAEALEELAVKNTAAGLTVPGVQKKLSLHLEEEGQGRLTLIGYPPGYILKPQTADFEQLPEAEDLVMDIAEMMGVKTVPHGLIDIGGDLAYICKRADRPAGDILAMEDFCQLSGRLTQDKYKGSCERCGGIIRKYSRMPGFDMSEFYLRLLVCFITGNSDMHLKNFSLIETAPGKREYVLSPAYDLLPVNVIMPEDEEETALTINGKKKKLRRGDFLALAERLGIPRKAAEKMIASAVGKVPQAIELAELSYLNDDLKAALIKLIEERSSRLHVVVELAQ